MGYVDKMGYQIKCNKIFKDLLDEAYSLFSISSMKELNSFYYMPNEHSGFADLDLTNYEFSKGMYFFPRIESFVRKYLANYVFVNMFEKFYHFTVKKMPDSLFKTNLDYENENYFEFILNKNGEQIGIKFCDNINDNLIKFCKENSIEHIIVLNWYVTNGKENHLKISDKIKASYYGAFDFVKIMFGDNEAIIYELFLRKVISDYQGVVGISAILKLTPAKLFEQRYNSKRNIINFVKDLSLFKKIEEKGHKQSFCYKYIVEKEFQKYESLEESSKKLLFESGILENFYDNDLYYILLAKSDISRSFFTSEYLYDNYNENDVFDFTSIISGYLKSVEQLIYKIVMQYKDKINQYNNLYFKIGKDRLDFTSEKVRDSDTTLGSLISFLQNYKKVTLKINIDFADILFPILETYKAECRNNCFHIHNNYDWEKVKKIRHNTFLVYILVIGAFRLQNSLADTYHYFEVIEDNDFENLFIQIHINGTRCFEIKTSENSSPEIVTVFRELALPTFDDYGVLNDFEIEFVNESKKHFFISKKKMPFSILPHPDNRK